MGTMCYYLSMKRRFPCPAVFLAVLLFVFLTLPLGAQGFFSKISWLAQGTVLFFPEDNGVDSDPMPILPSFGFGASYALLHISAVELKIETTFDFYMTHYGYSYTLERAVPLAIENRSARVLGSLFALQAAAVYDFSPLIRARFFAGPAADLRIVFLASGLNEGVDPMDEIRKETDDVKSYFWSKGRWFMPVIGSGVDFTLNSFIKLGIDFRVWIPMWKGWSGETLPAIEGWRFGVGARLTFR